MYRIYGNSKTKGWQKIGTKQNEEESFKLAKSLNADEYYSYMIIESSKDGDKVIERQNIYKECKVEFVDSLKTNIEVKATAFKLDRKKEKEIER